MDILETNCLTQLSQNARHGAMPMEYDDDFSDTATACSSADVDEDENGLEEDQEPPGYRYLGDPHLIDMMCRLKLFRDEIYLPKRISFKEQRATLEQLAAEVVHTHDDLGCFPTGEIRLLFRRAAKKLFRGIENRAKLQVQRLLILKHFEQVEEARILALVVLQHTVHAFDRDVPRCTEKGQPQFLRASVIQTQLPDIESVYIYDKVESEHNHIQQKLTAIHGDVTYVPGRATFVSEDAWSLATTASMLMRQYSALSERRVFLVKRLGFWTVPGMRVMAPSSEWDAQQWDAQQWDQRLDPRVLPATLFSVTHKPLSKFESKTFLTLLSYHCHTASAYPFVSSFYPIQTIGPDHPDAP
ncbi:hypothetical protein KC368_g57 [Hortaea werneckii]|nr:hypothetical protein KC368_g57 [Hortaea werneckii]